MPTMILRGVVIRYADLRFEKEGAVFCRLHLQADLSTTVLDDMGWQAIPDGITSAKLTGALTGRTLTLTPNDKDLKRHGFELECNDVGDFAVVPEKGDDGDVTGHRLNCMARSLEVGAITKVEQYRRLIGEGNAQCRISFERQEVLNFDAGTSANDATNEDEKEEVDEADDAEGEVVHLASAVEVAGNSHELKQDKKRRRKATDSLPSAPGDGEGHGEGIVRHLAMDRDGAIAIIDVLDSDGVLTWEVSANIVSDPEWGEMEIHRDRTEEPPLAVSHAVVAAANVLGSWAGSPPAEATKEAKAAYGALAAWCKSVAGEARVEGRTSA